MIRVLLVEDHGSYRQALEAVIRVEDGMTVVGHAAGVEDAAAVAEQQRPDVALVDLDLAGTDGVAAIQAIRERCSSAACVVLSASSDDVEFGRAIEAGASATLHKSVEIPDLLKVVRTVANGGTVLPATDTSRRLQALASSRNQAWHARILHETITPREREVLQLLASGLDNRKIGRSLGISPETVQTHIRNILAKLAVGSRLEAVVKALRYGLVKPPA